MMFDRDSSNNKNPLHCPLFFVWKAYQRRSETLGPLLGSQTIFLPHVFRHKALRPLDYVLKLLATASHIKRLRPSFVVFQAPPLIAPLAALFYKTPYIVDVHNLLLKRPWARIPLTRIFISRAAAVIVHNRDVECVFKQTFQSNALFTIQDPVNRIGTNSKHRVPNNILFICSFDSDEPTELIVDTVKSLPHITFTITADPSKLPQLLRLSLESCPNIRLPGFLSVDDYHSVLCSSSAAVVLSCWPDVQPSGACEALASDTPLIISRSPLTENLFGAWATLVENDLESLVQGIQRQDNKVLDLSSYRQEWNKDVFKESDALQHFLKNGRQKQCR